MFLYSGDSVSKSSRSNKDNLGKIFRLKKKYAVTSYYNHLIELVLMKGYNILELSPIPSFNI